MTITEHPTTPPLAPISTPRPAGPFRQQVEPSLLAVVHQVGVEEPAEPSTAPVLPPGAVPVAHLVPADVLPKDATDEDIEIHERRRTLQMDALQNLLAHLELPPFDLFVAGGIRLWTMSLPWSAQDWWVSVDYMAGATREDDGEKYHGTGAGRRMLLNYEAGRCHIGHPRAMEAAVDRRYSHLPELPDELAESLRGAFVTGPARQLRFLDGRQEAHSTDADVIGRAWPTWFRTLLNVRVPVERPAS